jgi:hypothetical protein
MAATAELMKLAGLPFEAPATVALLNTARRKLQLMYHPDRTGGSAEGFHKITMLHARAKHELVPMITVFASGVTNDMLEFASTTPVEFTRTTDKEQIGYERHTISATVPFRAALPIAVHVQGCGDLTPCGGRGDVVIQLCDQIVPKDDTARTMAVRVPETWDLVAMASVNTEDEMILGARLTVQTPYGVAHFNTGPWPSLQPQPQKYPGYGMLMPDGGRGTLIVWYSNAATLSPRTATLLANAYAA